MMWLRLAVVVAALAGCTKTDSGTGPMGTGAGTGGGNAGAPAAAGSGGGGAADPLRCETLDASMTPAALHAAAAEVLATPMGGTCNFGSCHIPPNGKAALILAGATDLSMLLRGVASCQAPSVPLVAAGGGDAALQNSWIWLKLVAADDEGEIVANPAWGPGGICGTTADKPFGGIMPMNSPNRLDETRLGKIRRWICGGAPGPQ
jgi:hypothetical protein